MGKSQHLAPMDSRRIETTVEENSMYIRATIKYANVKKVDLYKPKEVVARINKFFEDCAIDNMKPTVSGLALSLGVDRRRLWEMKTGAMIGGIQEIPYPVETCEAVRTAYVMLENLWEMYMVNGKINPVTGIFLGKNNFGYQDKVEHNIVTATTDSTTVDVDKILESHGIDSVPTIEE